MKIRLLIATIFMLICVNLYAQNKSEEKLWWAGITSQGHLMPITDHYHANIIDNTYGNQVQPLILSNWGDLIWSEDPFEFKIENNEVTIIQSEGEIIQKKVGNTLKSAYL